MNKCAQRVKQLLQSLRAFDGETSLKPVVQVPGISEVLVHTVVLPMESQSPSSPSFHPLSLPKGFPEFISIVGCESLNLSQSGAGRASQRTTMPESCLQTQHSISNSVGICYLHMGWIAS